MVKPISNIVIRDEKDIYNILTNREKLECLLQEYENKNHYLQIEQQVCCDENTPCVNNSSDNEKLLTSNSLSIGSSQYQVKYQDNVDYLHKGKNRHSKITREELDREQQILLKDNKEAIIDFLSGNKESIIIEDLKAYEPIYKCYRKKGNCYICNSLANIIDLLRN